MSKSEKPEFSADRPIKSDLAKLDAHVIAPEEYEDLPEITDEMMARADWHIGGKLIRRGRIEAEQPSADEDGSVCDA